MVNNIKFASWKPFIGLIEDDSTTDIFEDDEPLGDGNAATHSFTLEMSQIFWIRLDKVMHYMDVTNAITYQLYLLSHNPAAKIDELPRLIYQSDAAMADAQLYIETGGASDKLPTIARLPTGSTIHFKLDLSGASGDVTGFIQIEGLVYV